METGLNPLSLLFFVLSLLFLCSLTGSFVLRCPLYQTPDVKELTQTESQLELTSVYGFNVSQRELIQVNLQRFTFLSG